jgi:hypothetical protein
MSLVKVVYTKASDNSGLQGVERWLNTTTGHLYSCDRGIIRTGGPFNRLYGPYWISPSGTEIEEVHYQGGSMAPTQPVTPPGYPDGNPKSLQGAKKYSLRYLPLSANIAVNQALEDGAKKYGPANWREKGVAISVYIDAALRHLNQFYDGGQDNASDSGAPNLGHAMACMAIIIDAMAEGSAIDDRPFAAKDTDALLKRPGV